MRYGYRIVAQYNGRDAGLVGLASSRVRALAVKSTCAINSVVRRERWQEWIRDAIVTEERSGRIPRGVAISIIAR